MITKYDRQQNAWWWNQTAPSAGLCQDEEWPLWNVTITETPDLQMSKRNMTLASNSYSLQCKPYKI